MKLTFEIEAHQIVTLCEALRISQADYNRLQIEGAKGTDDLAARILTARNALQIQSSPVYDGKRDTLEGF